MTSKLISNIYTSRKTILNLMGRQGYNTKDYENFSINEVNSMFQSKQLDMLLEQEDDGGKKKKIYICYFLGKTLRPQNIQEIVDDLFHMEQILTKDDTLFIIAKEDMNETLVNLLKHIWEQDNLFIVIQNISRLQFNILDHSLVPEHRILKKTEVDVIRRKYNITNDSMFPEISRFDPVAQAICIRPGEICEIKRPSKTSIVSLYYRICVSYTDQME
jgi:DNA-directed RNA polymerase subunit H (RpoH/RPB5)